jgi:DNA-binding CsgD family transcriptional regulator
MPWQRRRRRNRASTGHPTFPVDPAGLRPRELDVVRLIARGLTSKHIARLLHISPLTVRKHRENAMRRLGVHGMAELIVAARNLGFTDTPSEP